MRGTFINRKKGLYRYNYNIDMDLDIDIDISCMYTYIHIHIQTTQIHRQPRLEIRSPHPGPGGLARAPLVLQLVRHAFLKSRSPGSKLG